MNHTTNTFAASLWAALVFLGTSDARPADPTFESQLFESGTLVYSDEFDGEYDRKRWGAPQKGKQIKDAKLVVTARFTSPEEAMKVLKRDHHLGLEPVVHLNRIPETFVCHMRYRFETEKLTPGRPSFQIGHHRITLGYLEGGGHRVKLPDGPTFTEPKSGMKLGEWIDLVIEYRKGTIRIDVNGYSRTYEHEKVDFGNEEGQARAEVHSQGRSELPNRLRLGPSLELREVADSRWNRAGTAASRRRHPAKQSSSHEIAAKTPKTRRHP